MSSWFHYAVGAEHVLVGEKFERRSAAARGVNASSAAPAAAAPGEADRLEGLLHEIWVSTRAMLGCDAMCPCMNMAITSCYTAVRRD